MISVAWTFEENGCGGYNSTFSVNDIDEPFIDLSQEDQTMQDETEIPELFNVWREFVGEEAVYCDKVNHILMVRFNAPPPTYIK